MAKESISLASLEAAWCAGHERVIISRKQLGLLIEQLQELEALKSQMEFQRDMLRQMEEIRQKYGPPSIESDQKAEDE